MHTSNHLHRRRTPESIRQRLKSLRRLAAVMGVFIFASFAYAFLSTAQPSQAATVGIGPWKTEGNRILDAEGHTVRIAGVNWFGFETDLYAPHGLWVQNYKSMIDQMHSLGYNTIRLPFSNQILDDDRRPNGINYGLNEDLQNLSSLQVMDKIIDHAGQNGMKVILVRHRPTADGQSALWYNPEIPEERWIRDWETLALRYKGNQTVIGADLHNEPHDPACWGCGDRNRDWRLAAEKAGNAIHAKNTDWLIFVEGVQSYNGSNYWWGGNLMGVRDFPVRLNTPDKLVYSVHDYPPSVSSHPWFSEAGYPLNLPDVWDTYWGYIHKQNIAPILVGEFGTKLTDTKDSVWLDTLVRYMGTGSSGISWTYWSWNPNSADTGGLVLDDWTNLNTEKHTKLVPIQFKFENTQLPTGSHPTYGAATSTPFPRR